MATTNPPIQPTSANASAARNRGSTCSRDSEPGHHQHDQQPQDAAQCQHQQHEQLRQLGASPSACHCQPSQLMQIQHTGRIPAHAAGSPPAAARVVPLVGIRPSSALDRVLAGQGTVEELLLPTPTNINPIHLPGDDLLLVGVQQWVRDTLHISLPPLDGMYVLVPSNSLQQPLPSTQHAACGLCSIGATHSSNPTADPVGRPAAPAAVCSAIPWRLRQVLRVEVPPMDSSSSSDPADATVVLVGGDRVRAGDVSTALLADTADYQYLCCELAGLQLSGQLRPLQVFDVAHLAWRMRVACDLDSCKDKHNKECAGQVAAGVGGDDDVFKEQAGRAHLEAASSTLMSLPPHDWVEGQILGYVELNPYLWPSSPDEPWQLLDQQQHSRLMEGAAAAWKEYVRCKHTGQQPQPVTGFVPWLPLHEGSQQLTPAPVSPEARHSQLPPAEVSHGSGRCGGDQGQSRSRSHSNSHAYEHSLSGSKGMPGARSSSCSDASASQHSRRADSGHRQSRSFSRSRSRSSAAASGGSKRTSRSFSRSPSIGRTHSSCRARSRNNSTSHSRACSRGRTRAQNRSQHSCRSRSYSRVSSRSTTRARSRSQSSGRSRSRSRAHSNSQLKARSRSQSGTYSRYRSRARSSSRRRARSSQLEARSRSRTRSQSRSRSRSRSRSGTAAAVRNSRSHAPSHHSPARRFSMDRASSRSHSRSRSSSRSRHRRSKGLYSSPTRVNSCCWIWPSRPLKGLSRHAVRGWQNGWNPDLYPNLTDPMSQYIHIKVQAWLQQLAVLLAQEVGLPEPGKEPCIVAHSLLRVHPLPQVVMSHYTSFSNFARVRPELLWVESRIGECFYLKEECHAQLLDSVQHSKGSRELAGGPASRRQASSSRQEPGLGSGQQQQPPPLDCDWPEYLAQEQQLYEAHSAAAAAAASLVQRLEQQ